MSDATTVCLTCSVPAVDGDTVVSLPDGGWVHVACAIRLCELALLSDHAPRATAGVL